MLQCIIFPLILPPMSDTPDLENLARRFLDLWQDQLAAMASDPEAAESLNRLMALAGPAGAAFATAYGQTKPGESPTHDGRAQTDTAPEAAPGAKTAAPAPGDGDDNMDELLRRLGDVERRLAELESRPGGAGGSSERKPRKRRK